MDLDFSALTDEQLTALLHAVIDESIHRGVKLTLTELQRAAIVFTAQERAAAAIRSDEARRIAREAAEKLQREEEQKRAADVAAKERRMWALRKGSALAVLPIFGAKTQINVWNNDSTKEKRVYIGGGFNANRVTYYVTGNKRNAPGSMDIDRDLRDRRDEIVALCKALAARWNAVKIDCDQAAAWDGEAATLAV